MKLTNEIKWYIRTRLDELVKPICDTELAKLKKDVQDCEVNLTAEVEKLIAETADKFVNEHPETQGIKVVITNTCPLQIEFDATKLEVSEKFRKASIDRIKRIDRLEILAHLDAQNCKDAIELDEMLIKLASHNWSTIIKPMESEEYQSKEE